MIKGLRRFIAGVAAIALAVGLGGWLIDRAVFRSGSVLSTIHHTGTCDDVAKVAPTIMVRTLALPPSSNSLLAGAVTPAYVCDRLDQFIPQLETYYRGNGSPPQLDLRDLNTQVESIGIPVPATTTSVLDHPIVYQNPKIDQPLQRLARGSARTNGLALVIAALGMGLVALMVKRHRLRSVAGVWLGGAIALTVEAGLIRLAPQFVASPVASSRLSTAAPAIRKLAEALALQASHQLIVAAVACVVVAIILVIADLVTTWRGRKPRSANQRAILAEAED